MPSSAGIRAGRAFVELGADDRRLVRGLKAAQAKLKAFGSKLSSIGGSLKSLGGSMLGFGAAAAAPLGLAIKNFADFDDQMRTVKAVTQASEAEFAKLTETAKRLGRTTSFTATEVASLMTELGRAGFSTQQIDDMTASVLNLSRATGTDATATAGIMAASIRQFNLEAGESSRVADALTAAANKSFNTLDSLGESLTYAGPVASDLNMSIEETLAILGALGNVGIQGSNAGTALRRLSVIGAAEAEKMKKIFGVNFVDASGDARNLVDVLDEVNQATAGLGTADRAAKFNEAFGLLGITGASAISKNAVSAKQLLTDIQAAGGIAQETAQEMDSGIGGAMRITMSALEGVALAIGEALEPVIMQVTSALQEGLGSVTAWIEENETLVSIIGGGIAAFVGLGAALVTVGVGFSAAGIVVSGLATAAGVAATVVGALGTVLAAIASPMGLAIGLAVALAAGFIYFTDVGKQVASWFSGEFSKLKSIVTSTLGGMFNAIKGGNLGLAAKIAFTGVKLAIATVMESVLALFGTSIDKMIEKLKEFTKNTATYTKGLLSVAGTVFNFHTNDQFKATTDTLTATAGAMTSALATNGISALDGLKLSLDTEALQQELEELNKTAKEQLDVEEEQTQQIDDANIDVKNAVEDLQGIAAPGFDSNVSANSNFGTFSAIQAARSAFTNDERNFLKRTAEASERTAKNTKTIQRPKVQL